MSLQSSLVSQSSGVGSIRVDIVCWCSHALCRQIQTHVTNTAPTKSHVTASVSHVSKNPISQQPQLIFWIITHPLKYNFKNVHQDVEPSYSSVASQNVCVLRTTMQFIWKGPVEVMKPILLVKAG